jgi:REP element-mobilizing transposase RayT
VFSTKYREPFIREPIDAELYSYMGAICNEYESQPIKIGGYTDHVHILCMLSRKIALMKLVEEIKSHSSKWMKTKDISLKNFYWQNGYAAFSVNAYGVDKVKRYIENQKKHHGKRKKEFKEELIQYFNQSSIEFDERYVWD